MKILVTGSRGMLGRTLMRKLSGHELVGVDIGECDITDRVSVENLISSHRPECVIHTAAFTAVDDCESSPELAFAVNNTGSENIAMASVKYDARLIAISTDYVFAGDLDRPYIESDLTGPGSVYGRSKLAGENAIREHCPNHIIARISWLYGPGGPSFLHTMLHLGAEQGEPLKVVDDQLGNPTSTDAVSDQLELLLAEPLTGVVHMTCEGEATWFQFAKEIFRLANLPREVLPCATDEFPRPAPRPANSRLENSVMKDAGLPAMVNWRDDLATFLTEYPDG